jgi:DNA invertase Pin-like site-specific DNA recombinase
MAEDERERIVKRANDGWKAARARGTKFGRKHKLTDDQQREARQRLEAGESARSVAKFLGVHHATVARVL